MLQTGMQSVTLVYAACRQLEQLWQELQSHPLMRYKEIIARVALTMGMLVILRLGYFIALPGVDLQHMPTLAPSGYQGAPLLLPPHCCRSMSAGA
jgi:hypothetical protein